MSVKLSPKYQVVIPEEARKKIGLVPGTSLDVVVLDNIVYIVPVKSLKDLQSQFRSRLDNKNIREKKDRS